MKFNSKILVSAVPLIFITGFLLFLTVPNPLLVQNQNGEKQTDQQIEESTVDDNSKETSGKTNENSVKLDIDNSLKTVTDEGKTDNTGTCTVTKNGESEEVPADSVKIDESSSGDLSIKVDCENSISQSSNKTSIKNKIEIKANSSN